MNKKISVILLAATLSLGSVSSYGALPIVKHNIEAAKAANTNELTAPTQAQQADETTSNVAAPVAPAATGNDKNQIIAILLCLFLGGLGIHRFYLGYTWQGVVQLLTGGGLGIWALIDLIRICFGSLKPKGGKYK